MNNEKSAELALIGPQELMRHSTDVAGVSKEIVMRTAMSIQGRKYVKLEGWQAIAVAHGCMLSACDVERIDGGVRAMGEVRRMADGVLLAKAEGFVGEDETTWYGGETTSYGKTKTMPKRPDYAIRAMAQTRAMSRAARSAFAHVVVLIDTGLSTTPAEEVPLGGFGDEGDRQEQPTQEVAPKAKPVSKKPVEPIAQIPLPQTWKAYVFNVEERSGIKQSTGKPWKVFDITFDLDGDRQEKASTFDAKLADAARKFNEDNTLVSVSVLSKERGFELLGMVPSSVAPLN